jgi:ribosome recycling factor
MVNDVLSDLQASMEKALEAFKRDLAKVRTGRANIAMLDGVKVEYYGTPTPLNQVATLNVPDARLITIKPWEKSLVPVIEKAIKAHSELGLNPNSDGELVRLPIPPLTQERRKDLVKMLKKLAEEAKVALRGGRREANETLKELRDGGDVTEDDERAGLKKIQDVTDKWVAMVDEIAGKKEKEILES